MLFLINGFLPSNNTKQSSLIMNKNTIIHAIYSYDYEMYHNTYDDLKCTSQRWLLFIFKAHM